MDMRRTVRKGFTLVEILVTVIVVGVLSAVIIPAITQQVTAGDASRIVEDLGSVANGIKRFGVDVRPKTPGDIEDLINLITNSTTQDISVDGGAYAAIDIARWNGPYIEKPSPTFVSASSSVNIFIGSGYAANIIQGLLLCSSAQLVDSCSSTNADYISVKVGPLTVGQFEVVNKIIDGTETAGSSESYGKGRFRYDGSFAYYLAQPYRAP